MSALRKKAAGLPPVRSLEAATQTVFGEGPIGARVMLVGEQPGDQEDLAGEPFVGPAGNCCARRWSKPASTQQRCS